MRFALHSIRVLCAIFAAVVANSAAAQAKRVALVIGNSAYEHTRVLPNARSDARLIAELLRKIGFEVTEAGDAAYRPMREALRAFGQTAQGAEMALVYFAGHGLEVAAENWLLPTSAALTHERDLEYEAVSLSSILTAVKDAAKLRLVILDACRNNPLGERITLSSGATRSVVRGLARVEPSGDILVAYSAKHGTLAEDGPAGGHSPFAAALALNMGTPGLDIRILLGKVRDAVKAATGGRQEPFTYGSVGGEMIALVPGDGPSIAPVLPRPVLVRPLPDNGTPATKPPMVPTYKAPSEPLPPDIPVSPEMLQLVETHPFFAGPPPVSVGSYRIYWTSKFVVNGFPVTNTSDDTSTTHWIRKGVIKTNFSQQMTSRHASCPPGSCDGVNRSVSIMAANGMIVLGSKSATSTWKLVRLENVVGTVFPLHVGKRFSYSEVVQTNSPTGRDEVTTRNQGEIASKHEARRFHPELAGLAYLKTCHTQTIHKREKSSNRQEEARELFFDKLGVWLQVDPMEGERMMQTDSSGTTAYALKSFDLVR